MVQKTIEQFAIVRQLDTMESRENKVVVNYKKKPYQIIELSEDPSNFKTIIELADKELQIASVRSWVVCKIKLIFKKWHA